MKDEALTQGYRVAQAIEAEIGKVVYGAEIKSLIEFLILAVFSDGHVLVRSDIGLGKTLTCSALAKTLGGIFRKRQFRPDMMPSEISGNEIYNEETKRFETHHGPLYQTNVFLADEINRGTPKAQAALLEAMEERHLTIGKQVFYLEPVFLSLATQNPIEHEGVYDLPEAELDRFLGRPGIGFPSKETSLRILADPDYWRPPKVRLDRVQAVTDSTEIVAIREAIHAHIHAEPRLERYIISLVEATHEHKAVKIGPSPRGEINLKKAATVAAFRANRTYVTPEDVRRYAVEILAHRIFMKDEYRYAQDREYTAASIIQEILENVKYD